jgi:PAS domain S-box-containing protein
MQNNQPQFSRNVWLTASMLVAVALLFLVYIALEKRVDDASAVRFQSMRLAEDLRRSSDDLTRMARTYVATGDRTFKEIYQEILDIRNGIKPRPIGYENSYWDHFVAAKPSTPEAKGETISLLDLMRQAGFTSEEFDKLAQAKASSDGLARIEVEAMTLIADQGPRAMENRARALANLHDDRYHQHKAVIMRPIAEVSSMVEVRTRMAVESAQSSAAMVRLVLVLLGLGSAVMLARINKSLRVTLGASLDAIHAHLTRLGEGNFSTEITVPHGMQGSVLDSLSQTQTSLQHMDSERRLALAARLESARESQTLMDAINMYSIVSIADPAGNITYANEMFSQVSGYTNAELIGQNHRIVKSDAQPDGYWETVWKTISSGYVWRGEVCNRAKDGSPYWVDTVIAPFFGDSGIEKYISIRTDVSQNKRFQQTLDAERQRLVNIISGTRAGTWEWNCQTGAGVVNARWAEMIGYTLDEINGDPNRVWRNSLNADDLVIAGAHLKRHLTGASDIYEFEGRVRHKDGHWIWQLTRGKLFSRTPDGKPEWMYGINLDITHIKQAQAELKESETVLRDSASFMARAGRIAGIGRWQYDMIKEEVEWSDQTCQIHDVANGHTPTFQEAVGYFAPEARNDIEAALAAAMKTGKPWDLELRLITAMSRSIWVRCAGESEYRDGKRIRLVGIFQDITQRRKLEEEIRQKNVLMENILINIPVGLSVMDHQLNLVVDNPLFRTLLDFPDSLFAAEKVKFESIIRFNAERGEYGDGDRDAIVQSIVARARMAEAHRFQRQRGDGRTLEVRGAPMPDGGFVTTYTDITDLTRATQAAQDASRSKSQFVANMSHEIRTPMNAILGMLKLLHNTDLTARQMDYASKAEGAAKSLLGLLNDVLDFSKMEAGKMELDPQAFRMDHLLRDLAVILSANLGTKPIEVLFDVDPTLPRVLLGDAMRLQQVLINLAGNAIKFTNQGEVVVQFKVLTRTDTHTTLRIAVRDSGIGIAPENQKHIFDGFSQAEASTTRRFGGTGLGLSICKRLVELMGGALVLDSALGQGSTFHFTLTLASGENVGAGVEPPPPRQAIALHVLVVDDNTVARDLMAAMAQSWGWQVDAASSGAQALQLIERRASATLPPYDALFVDWLMPGMDGWETIERIGQLDVQAQSPITVMITAHGREMLAQRKAHEQARLNAFLVKPITASMLFDTVVDARAGLSNLRAKPRSANASAGRLAGMRLLVVEDNVINQQVARELLTGEGAQVEVAGNGQLGVAAISSASPAFHAVLMDLQMPVMDGYAATRAIRSDLGLLQLPIIAMTANAMASDRDACLRAGMNDHIGKPFDLPHLIDVLLQHTRRARPAPPPPAQVRAPAPTITRAAPTDSAGLPPVDCINPDEAIARLGGNARLYSSVLESYLSELKDLPEQLDVLLAGSDLQGAGRLLHTLKGLSATVGASYLAALTKGMETTLRNDPTAQELESLRIQFRHTADRTQTILEPLVALHGPSTTAAIGVASSAPDSTDWTQVQHDLDELHALLLNSDLQALEIHSRMLINQPLTAVNGFDALSHAIAGFDFAQAAVHCEQLLNTLCVRPG